MSRKTSQRESEQRDASGVEPRSVDLQRCEICGEPNECAMESEDPAVREAPCWCVEEQFPKELLQTVDGLRAEGAAKRCICRRCVARHSESG